jgi:hypothetical protein
MCGLVAHIFDSDMWELKAFWRWLQLGGAGERESGRVGELAEFFSSPALPLSVANLHFRNGTSMRTG